MLAVLGVVCSASPAVAQDVTEPSLKAAFVYNLAKFTEWPDDVLRPAAPIVMCVAGDAEFAQAMERTVKGRPLLGHPVTMVRLSLTDSPRACQVLYTAGVALAQVEALLASTRDLPILTVVDIDAGRRPPGIARMFVENGKIRFDLDYGLAKRSRLQLSAKLVSLAKKVYDDQPRGAQ
jgi:hypothetical protein